MKEIRTVILAAGKGTRMKSETPKVLHLVCGKPLIHYVLDIAKAIGSLKTYVVLGHKSDQVKAVLPKDVITVDQPRMLGTADAVKCAENHLRAYRGDVLILCGDTPLLDGATVKKIVRKHKRANALCTFLTAVVHDPKGYGRIIRADKGVAVAIREDKDAAGFEKDIEE
ncbi:MAG TPA: NTP transferase domain-containing protein, partial [Candidatus Omnitrophota bacterium]|nr:NTP transferase domain-containing protein [Candidatus Omnitrophota bacterium]